MAASCFFPVVPDFPVARFLRASDRKPFIPVWVRPCFSSPNSCPALVSCVRGVGRDDGCKPARVSPARLPAGAAIFVVAAVLLGALFKAAIFAVIAKLAETGGDWDSPSPSRHWPPYVFARWWAASGIHPSAAHGPHHGGRAGADDGSAAREPIILDVRPELVR